MLSSYDKTDLAAFRGPGFPLNPVMKAFGKDVIAVIERRAFHGQTYFVVDKRPWYIT
jgi:hypothetical protein